MGVDVFQKVLEEEGVSVVHRAAFLVRPSQVFPEKEVPSLIASLPVEE